MSANRPLTNQPFLELTYSILLMGVGCALLFNVGASSGGTDIIALVLKKFTNLNIGKALLVCDFIVATSAFFIFSAEAGLYSLLGVFAQAFLVDGVIESIGKNNYITIITTKPKEIGDYILNVIQHSYTTHPAEGGYTHEEKTVILTVCKRPEAYKIKNHVKQVDSEAFVIINDAKEILGKGFRGIN